MVVKCDFSLVTSDFPLTDISVIIQLKFAELFLVGCRTARFELRMRNNKQLSQLIAAAHEVPLPGG